MPSASYVTPLKRIAPTAIGVALSCTLSGPAQAADAPGDFDRDAVVEKVVVSADRQNQIVVSFSRPARQEVLHLTAQPLAVAVADVDHDGRLDLSALLPHRRLVVWLNAGNGEFAQLQPHAPLNPRRASRPKFHGWHIRRSPLEHALRFGTDSHARRSAPTTQGTPSGFAGLHVSPIEQAAPPGRFVLGIPPDRLPTRDGAGRHESRGPPRSLPV